MSAFLVYLIPFFMLATLAVLVIGLVGFARNSAFYQRNANRLMRWRVGLQFVAVMLAMLALWLASGK